MEFPQDPSEPCVTRALGINFALNDIGSVIRLHVADLFC